MSIAQIEAHEAIQEAVADFAEQLKDILHEYEQELSDKQFWALQELIERAENV